METIGELCTITYNIKDKKFYFFDNNKNQLDPIFENYFACIYLGIIGDYIGFGNGDIEFYNQNNIFSNDRNQFINNLQHISSFLIFNFLLNDSTSQYNFKSYTYSDDTIMLLANLKALISDFNDGKQLYINTSLTYLDFFKDEKLLIEKYKAGIKTIDSLRKIRSGTNWKDLHYDPKAGGSGASMRSSIYGLCFYKSSNLSQLIESSIETAAITHNNGIAFLGSFTNALFTSYALQKIPITRWCYELISLLSMDDNPVDTYIERNHEKNYQYYLKDKEIFLNKFRRYMEDNFNDFEYIQYDSSRSIIPGNRILYYYDNFGQKNKFNPGSGSDDSIIIAYDCVILCRGNFEKLIYLAMLNLGDSDTIGMIAGNLYGAYYGLQNVYLNYIFNDDILDNYILKLMNNKNIIDSIYLLFNKYYNKNIKL